MRFPRALFAVAFVVPAGSLAYAGEMGAAPATEAAEPMGMARNPSDLEFAPLAGMPNCTKMAVESGDPATGPSVIIFKASAACVIPRHWHTPTEHVLIVSGEAKVEMMDDGSVTMLGPGGYAMMPSKHVHQFTCMTDCLAFVTSDGAFDIHYVDGDGNELAPDTVLGAASAAGTGERPVLGFLEMRDARVTLLGGPDGPRYTVAAGDGRVLAEQLTRDQLASRFPELNESVSHGFAEARGNLAILAE